MRVVVGIGANLGARRASVAAALAHLEAQPWVAAPRASTLVRSDALTLPGISGAPDFCNAALAFDLLAEALPPSAEEDPLERCLRALQGVETAFCRTRTARWDPRTLDLDVLWAPEARATPTLVVPHPGLFERPFALGPALDVHPALRAHAQSPRPVLPAFEEGEEDRWDQLARTITTPDDVPAADIWKATSAPNLAALEAVAAQGVEDGRGEGDRIAMLTIVPFSEGVHLLALGRRREGQDGSEAEP